MDPSFQERKRELLEELRRIEQLEREYASSIDSTPTSSQNYDSSVSTETEILGSLTQQDELVQSCTLKQIDDKKVLSKLQKDPERKKRRRKRKSKKTEPTPLTSRQYYSSSVDKTDDNPHQPEKQCSSEVEGHRSPFSNSENRNTSFDTYATRSITEENQQSKKNDRNFVSSPIPMKKDDTLKQKKYRPSLFATYQKREGISNRGIEYEQVMCGLYALKFSTCDDVEDFEMTSNDAQADILFDDINIKVTFKDGREHTFLFQLKHYEDENKVKKCAEDEKNQGKINFKNYLRLRSEEKTYILYTNSFPPDIDKLRAQNSIVEEYVKCDEYEFGRLILNTKQGDENAIFCLKSEDETKSFYYVSRQFNVHEAAQNIKETLKNLLHYNVSDHFFQFMATWWSEKYILTKYDFIAKVAEMAFSPFLMQLNGVKNNEKTEFLEKAIMDFQVTIMAPDGKNIIESIWTSAAEENIETYFQTTKKFNLLPYESSKVLWYLNKVPLVVKVDDANVKTIQSVLELLERRLENKKLILVGNISRNIINEKWDVFENLNDLIRKDSKNKYVGNIMHKFEVSLQGKESISLTQLVAIDENIGNFIGVTELLEMSQKEYLLIGEPQNQLPELHIPRLISVHCVKQEQLLTFYQSRQDEAIIIINCDQTFQVEFKVNTMEISDYLNPETHKKPGRLILLSRKNKCSPVQFQKICEMSGSKNVFLLQVINDEDLIILQRKGYLELKWTEKQIKEADIYSLETQLNVFCAPPGMGKSRLIKVLSNSCPSTYWSHHVDLIKCSFDSIVKRDPQTVLDFLLDTTGDCLVERIRRVLLGKQKMHIFLDGLDEVDRKYVSLVIDLVKYISSKGVNSWISSRENLRELICRELHVVPMEIKQLYQEQQTEYIHRKLRGSYGEEQIEKIVSAVLNSADLNNSRELLGIPLQLHIITEVFLNNNEAYENLERQNIFVLTQMYKLFFDGKIKSATEKIVGDSHLHLLGHTKYLLKRYEILALKACLDSEDLSKLQLNMNETKDFVNELKENGDKYGIVREVNEAEEAVFVHQTYAEYFACVWFKRNQDVLRKLRDVIFSERYENLRLMLDVMLAENSPIHLAIIYKNLNLFEKNIVDVNKKDEGGRSVLHVACCYGTRNNHYYKRLIRDPPSYINMMEILLQGNEIISEIDDLFSFDCIQYACKQRCLYPIEIILQKKFLTFDQIENTLLEHFDEETIIINSARLGYPYLLSALVRNNPKYLNQGIKRQTLLKHAVKGLDNDICTTPRIGNIATVRMLVSQGVGKFLTNEKDKTILDHACELRRFDMINILIEEGFKCSEGNTIWHILAEINDMSEKEIVFLENFDTEEDVNLENFEHETPLQIACREGNFGMVNVLIKRGGNITAIGVDNRNLLHYASKCDHDSQQIINLLVGKDNDSYIEDFKEQAMIQTPIPKQVFEDAWKMTRKSIDSHVESDKVDLVQYVEETSDRNRDNKNSSLTKLLSINERDVEGMTPLLLACQRGVLENVEALLRAGADLTVQDAENKGVLHYAVQSPYRNDEIIKLLVENGAPVNFRDSSGITPLLLACQDDQLVNVETLLRAGTDPTVQDAENRGVLRYASQSYKSNNEIINLLVEKGASVNARDSAGITPLLLTCRNGVLRNVVTLLRAGADPTIKDAQNRDILHYVSQSEKRNEEIVNFLVEKGAPVNGLDATAATPLLLACQNGVLENVEAFLRAEADPTVQDAHKSSALHYAVKTERNNHKVINLLIRNNVAVNATDMNGTTPLQLACQFGCFRNVEVLLEEGANANVVDIKGNTALHYASRCTKKDRIGNRRTIQLLINNGFKMNIRNKNGKTAFDIALTNGYDHIVEILREMELD